MKVAVFDTHRFEKEILKSASQNRYELTFFENRLTAQTANLANGFSVVCCFVNDQLNADVLRQLKSGGVKLIALRSAGFNHVDLQSAAQLGITVVRVPEYSPHAVAEHAVTLLMALNRKIHKATNRVHEMNFSLEGLVGFDLHGKTVGVVGTGKIGAVFCQIMHGFGCHLVAHDPFENRELSERLKIRYVSKQELLKASDVISLHCPLNTRTRHFMDYQAFELLKPTAYLINTGRGALIETKALIQALKSRRLGGACLDVYEEEEGVFFQDYSDTGVDDDLLARLLTFPNVIMTAHQAFLTQEALQNIAETTVQNISDFENENKLLNQVSWTKS